jgi:CheY-like chemotaxis protein
VAKAQILVVEDEGIVAMDVRNRLKGLGYAVPVVVSSGERALKRAEEIHLD